MLHNSPKFFIWGLSFASNTGIAIKLLQPRGCSNELCEAWFSHIRLGVWLVSSKFSNRGLSFASNSVRRGHSFLAVVVVACCCCSRSLSWPPSSLFLDRASAHLLSLLHVLVWPHHEPTQWVTGALEKNPRSSSPIDVSQAKVFLASSVNQR
jgi:hypothetical protein